MGVCVPCGLPGRTWGPPSIMAGEASLALVDRFTLLNSKYKRRLHLPFLYTRECALKHTSAFWVQMGPMGDVHINLRGTLLVLCTLGVEDRWVLKCGRFGLIKRLASPF